MLKNRGSMTVEDVDLLNDVIRCLKEHEKLKGARNPQAGATIVSLLIRALLDPHISRGILHFVSDLIDKLR